MSNNQQSLGPSGSGAAGSDSQTRAGAQTRSQQPFSNNDLNRIVLEYLSKKGYYRTEMMLRTESSNTPTPAAAPVTPANSALTGPGEIAGDDRERDLRGKVTRTEREISQLKERQAQVERELQETRDREQQLVKEKELRDLQRSQERKRDDDPEVYRTAYSMLSKWVDTSLDLYRPELQRLLYPLFIHCFLELVVKNYPADAQAFFDRFKADHMVLHGAELKQLAGISLGDHVAENPLAQAYRHNRYKIIVLKTSLNLLLYFLHENEAVGGAILIRIINQYLDPEIATTNPDKVDHEGEANPEEGIPAIMGINHNDVDLFNDQPVKLGKMPLDPEVQKEVEAEIKIKDEKSEPVNGKTLTEEFANLTKPDADLPAREQLPLPLRDANDIKKMILAVDDARHQIKLGAVQSAAPSVCMYTFHNTNNDMTCVNFNEDLNLVAAGFDDSYIKLWLLDGKPLRLVFKRDRERNESLRKLVGHAGPVYGVSFSPDNKFLILGSQDKTVRLWSLDTYSALVSYKGHLQPIWDVKFSPLGHYFVTGSHDQTARLWATDHVYPLRIFAGHINDVDCVDFHPNSNYVFTGSSDKLCRMWDVHTGNCVRVFMGHTQPINCMAVSPDGRWLASAGEDSVINIWDCGLGRRLKTMKGHGRLSIYSLAFSRDGSVLVSGGADNTVRVWDVKKNTNDAGPEPEAFTDGGVDRSKSQEKSRKEIVATSDHMTAYFTKKTPVYKVHFTRRNLCLAGGAFSGSLGY